jgi:hypothetical protein
MFIAENNPSIYIIVIYDSNKVNNCEIEGLSDLF